MLHLPKAKDPEQDAIIVENVSKRFRIPHEKKTTLFEHIKATFTGSSSRYEEFLALKDVSFRVKKGETLGIIGENGSGKSTLLKIIAGVLTPDSGSVRVNGRIAPFLELGVGFQPELTAEENVRLYGAVMGMKKNEIENKFEGIFEFAELERFKEMKLKNFSSGMYMRLAFATAIATEPEIMLIDEVLAVGDVAFQRKCFDKIDEIKRSERTIIFVSHDMNSIMKLCRNSVFLEHGSVRFKGNTEKVIYEYHSYMNRKEIKDYKESVHPESAPKDRYGGREIEITGVKLIDKNNEENSVFSTQDAMKIQIHYKLNKDFEKPTFGVGIFSNDGTYITGIHTRHDEIEPKLNRSRGTATLCFNELPLLEGIYKITVGVCSDNRWDRPYDVRTQQYSFKVQSTRKYDGFVQFPHTWEIQ